MGSPVPRMVSGVEYLCVWLSVIVIFSLQVVAMLALVVAMMCALCSLVGGSGYFSLLLTLG